MGSSSTIRQWVKWRVCLRRDRGSSFSPNPGATVEERPFQGRVIVA